MKKLSKNVIIATGVEMWANGLVKGTCPKGETIFVWKYSQWSGIHGQKTWAPLVQVTAQPVMEDTFNEHGEHETEKSQYIVAGYYMSRGNRIWTVKLFEEEGIEVTEITERQVSGFIHNVQNIDPTARIAVSGSVDKNLTPVSMLCIRTGKEPSEELKSLCALQGFSIKKEYVWMAENARQTDDPWKLSFVYEGGRPGELKKRGLWYIIPAEEFTEKINY